MGSEMCIRDSASSLAHATSTLAAAAQSDARGACCHTAASRGCRCDHASPSPKAARGRSADPAHARPSHRVVVVLAGGWTRGCAGGVAKPPAAAQPVAAHRPQLDGEARATHASPLQRAPCTQPCMQRGAAAGCTSTRASEVATRVVGGVRRQTAAVASTDAAAACARSRLLASASVEHARRVMRAPGPVPDDSARAATFATAATGGVSARSSDALASPPLALLPLLPLSPAETLRSPSQLLGSGEGSVEAAIAASAHPSRCLCAGASLRQQPVA